ncbi:non-ribosomal peptide synthetase [Amycolatopsis rubida]|uniref:Amino acid adenylation domain-containing protein/thioester reductase domain-containing protein n=1 Tax=Amycolatopsis rubida TaxID=112413 RepID=A0A1I5RSK0_9PSEU|nr:non-ribosomal peptide synthetase [Amycolatopsis rubida]SFP60936.1 amino acid adenylation domain-containing protein/thioester reductase domain-containing protein [Amycolatopsis rubida]
MTHPEREQLFRLLAARDGLGAATGSIPRRTGDAPVPLLPAQRQLWFLDRLGARDGVYTISQSWRLAGPLDVEALRRALATVVERHEALRAGFAESGGEPVQIPALPGTAPELSYADLRGAPESADQVLADERARPFDLARPPLVRGLLVALADDVHLFVLTLHHIVADAASVGVLLRELSALYPANAPALPEPPVRYGDYAAWQATKPLEAGERYWREQLHDAPALLELPADRPRPPAESFRGNGHSFHLSADLAAFCHRHGVTANTVLLTAYVLLLARHAGQDDVVVGMPMRDETVPGIEQCVGMFANTVAVRTRLTGDPTVAEVLARVQDACLGALEHQSYPWERVARDLRPARDLSHNPVFQAMFVLNSAGAGLELPGIRADWLDLPVTTARFDLTLALATAPDGIEGRLDYATDLFDAATVARFAGQYEHLLRAMLAAPDAPVSTVDALSAEERTRLRNGGHPAPPVVSDGTLVTTLITGQAARTPDAIAVEDDGRLTYAELVSQARRITAALHASGVRRGDLVALGLSTGAITGLLGVLLAGAAYLPLDPGHPPARLAGLLADAAPAALITDHDLPFDGPVLHPDRLPEASPAPELPLGPGDLAYVIYTSGSTGAAKPVAVCHGALAELAESFRKLHGFGPGERVLMIPPLTFDAAAGDIFPALVSGATVLPWRDPASLTGPGLVRLCRDHGITMVDTASALWQKWVAELAVEDTPFDCPLRTMMVGGEAVPTTVAQTWAALTGGRVELHNHYGPTEATVCATSYLTFDADELDGRVQLPIGDPLPHVRAYVVDDLLRAVLPGVPGELCLGGDAPARGYRDRPGATAEKFVPDPFSPAPGARMYRTGDLARLDGEGRLEFLGRVDRQLKVRGHRIEPAEVEAACRRHPGVRDVLVTARADRLVAYLAGDVDPLSVRSALRAALPGYLVPDAFAVLPELPLNAHGKVDHRALPEPAGTTTSAFAEPEGELEQRLAAIWAAVLDVDRIGRDDDFFLRGGHSLLAGTLMAKVRAELDVEVPVRTLFEASTLAAFAEAVRAPGYREDDRLAEVLADAVLPADIDTRCTPAQAEVAIQRAMAPRIALLTGASGFLGPHLLADLLRHSDVVVRCLVRAAGAAEGAARIEQVLRDHLLWDERFRRRIIAVPGDLGAPRLGLPAAELDAVAADLDVIFHCGGEANFLRPYAQLRPGNVLGTTELLRLASRGGTPVHLVSSLGVYPLERDAVITEDIPPDDPAGLDRGYEQSKWAADRLARAARERGLPVTVHRPARVTGHSRTGIGPLGDRFANLLRCLVLLGSAPAEDFAVEEDMAPVDHVAAAIGHLSRRRAGYGCDFHFHNQRTMRFGEVVAGLREFGYPIEAIPFEAWHSALASAAAETADPALSAITAMIERTSPPRRTVFDCSHTEVVVAAGGLVCPAADRVLLQRYLAHYVRIGHLPAAPRKEHR